ncbi:hypothetical protein VitviT2T_001730 [Vitis vinifera]|uniref:Glycoside hydrolase family 5 domain-containing protein n=2 Tax=Vitis vinifera TaxID=29760 RepID=A0ABY9BGK8_VITVI|nr:glycosyl hydrolase 5 family protein [Vitis vinifera]WJZ81921.1 hypothetical protein VitviT2T_001730 [Vitis vinifera]|eukprot:XP_002272422.2 PREDICTED: uncharacterized protein LOC100245045 [Vitis vinifera]
MKTLQIILLIFLSLFGAFCYSLPLSTRGRWIVDSETGHRVKLTCLNWVAHTETMVTEGLHTQPIKDIAAKVTSMGFNCIRLTYATFMWTRSDYSNKTVAQSLDSFNLTQAREGIARNNPQLLNLSLQEAYEAVVDELGANGLMLVLDNHVSKPMWCCAREDGNGFFGDMFFDPKEWIEGLTQVAKRFKGKPQVVAMSMRNEIRGPRQNLPDWYKNMREGAKAIHSTNPDVLVLVSGLNFDKDLSFLSTTPFGLTLDKKVVYEAHWYSFDFTQQWQTQPLNRVCRQRADEFQREAAFLITGDNAAPLIISEFGVDLRGVNQADNRYFNCLLPTVAEKDLDWALWTLQASYYYREGKAGPEEVYSVLDYNWDKPRDPKYLERLTILQQTIQDPNSTTLSYYLIVHTESGFCVNVEGEDNVHGSSCRERSKWSHGGDGWPIRLVGGELCLKAVGDGVPVTLSTDCKSPRATWKLVSDSRLHVAAMDEQGNSLCLEATSSNYSSILTRRCACVKNEANCDPQSQWFKLVPSNLS